MKQEKPGFPEVRIASIRLPHSVLSPFLPSRLTRIAIGPSTLRRPFWSRNRPHITTSFLCTDVDHFRDALRHHSTPSRVPARTVLHLRLTFGAATLLCDTGAAFGFAASIGCWSWRFWCYGPDGSRGGHARYPARRRCSSRCTAPSHRTVTFTISTTIVLAPSDKSIPP